MNLQFLSSKQSISMKNIRNAYSQSKDSKHLQKKNQCKPIIRTHQKQQLSFRQKKSERVKFDLSKKQAAPIFSQLSTLREIKATDENLNYKLRTLKQLWHQQPIIDKIKSVIMQFKPPLPYEYEKAILYYCSGQKIHHQLFFKGSVMNAARIFKFLMESNNDLFSILELNNDPKFQFVFPGDKANAQNNSQNQYITFQQENILIYNTLNLYYNCGMIKQFMILRQKLVNFKKIEVQVQTLTANACIRFSSEFTHTLNQIQQQKKARYQKIINKEKCYQEICSTETCTRYEAFNIGLIYKKCNKFDIAAKIFQKLKSLASAHQKIKLYATINYAKCLFSMNLRAQAIRQLKLLQCSTYMKPYEQELAQKIKCWTKTYQLYLMKKKAVPNEPNNHKKNIHSINVKQSSDFTLDWRKKQSLQTNETQCTNYTNKFREQTSKVCWPKNTKMLQTLKQQERELNKFLKTLDSDKQQRKTLNIFRSPALCYRICSNKSKKYRYKKLNSCNKNLKQVNLNSYATEQNGTDDDKTLKLRINGKKDNIAFVSEVHLFPMQQSEFRFKEFRRSSEESSIDSSIMSISDILTYNKSLFSIQSNITKTKIPKASGKQEKTALISSYVEQIRNTNDKTKRGELYLALGQLYKDNKNYDMALTMLKNAYDCGNHRAAKEIGQINYIKKNYREAVQFLERYVDKYDINQIDLTIKQIHCYSKLPDLHHKGTQKAKQILQDNPHNKQAHALLVNLYYKQKNFTKAIQLCLDHRQKYFYNYDNHHLLGLLYKATKNYKNAYDCFLNALKIEPNCIKSLIQIVDLVKSQNFFGQLLELFKRALFNSHKKHEMIQFLKILIEKKTLKNAKISDNLNFPQLVAHGDFFASNQMIQEAQVCYLQAKNISDNNLISEKLGNAAFYQGQYTKAYQYFKQSQLRKPRASVQLKIAQIKMKQNKFQESKKIITKWMSKQPENQGFYHYNLGLCQYNLGNEAEALINFKKSLKSGYQIEENNNWINKCSHKIADHYILDEKINESSEIDTEIILKPGKKNYFKLFNNEPIELLFNQRKKQGKQKL